MMRSLGQLHVTVAQSGHVAPRNLTKGGDHLNVRIITRLRSWIPALMEILQPGVPKTFQSHELRQACPSFVAISSSIAGVDSGLRRCSGDRPGRDPVPFSGGFGGLPIPEAHGRKQVVSHDAFGTIHFGTIHKTDAVERSRDHQIMHIEKVLRTPLQRLPRLRPRGPSPSSKSATVISDSVSPPIPMRWERCVRL